MLLVPEFGNYRKMRMHQENVPDAFGVLRKKGGDTLSVPLVMRRAVCGRPKAFKR